MRTRGVDPSFEEKLSHFLDSLRVINDIERTGIDLQSPLKFAPYWITFINHLKDRRC